MLQSLPLAPDINNSGIQNEIDFGLPYTKEDFVWETNGNPLSQSVMDTQRLHIKQGHFESHQDQRHCDAEGEELCRRGLEAYMQKTCDVAEMRKSRQKCVNREIDKKW